ncbi:MAG TPA: hypothetical protein VF017_12685 [Thermoanaerobaculia bacterium]|nr:hypothetical protein [Thermoanaerobaculia bacterium]
MAQPSPSAPAPSPLTPAALGVVLAGTAAATWVATAAVRDSWVRLGLCLLGLALVLLGPRWRRARPWQGVALAVLAVAAVTHSAGPDLWRYVSTPWVRVWNVYHYYVGAKYFGEVGYSDIYRLSLAVDRVYGDYWQPIENVRDLDTYEVVERASPEVEARWLERLTPERRLELARDLSALAPHMRPKDWRAIFRDRGYNATPFWTVVGRAVAELLPATSPRALKALSGLDLLLLPLTFLALARAFGARRATWVLVLFCLSPVNQERLVGGFLQYDWFAAIALGFAWLRGGRPVASALAFAYATLARVFPALLVASLALPVALRFVRRRRLARRDGLFAATFAAALVVGFGLGCLTPRGVGAWGEFVAKIGVHTEAHQTGEQRIGLAHALTRDLGRIDLDAAEGPSKAARRTALAAQRPLYYGLAGLLVVGWLGATLLRRNRGDALLLGLVPVFALTVASRYYWATLALFGAWSRNKARRGLITAQLAIFGGFALLWGLAPDAWTAYNLTNLALTLLFLGLVVTQTRRGARVLRRARAIGSLRLRSPLPPVPSPPARGRRPE